MYEYGLRLGREAPGTKSLKKQVGVMLKIIPAFIVCPCPFYLFYPQANCYCMCLTALHLAEPQYAWIVVPVELGEILAKVDQSTHLHILLTLQSQSTHLHILLTYFNS